MCGCISVDAIISHSLSFHTNVRPIVGAPASVYGFATLVTARLAGVGAESGLKALTRADSRRVARKDKDRLAWACAARASVAGAEEHGTLGENSGRQCDYSETEDDMHVDMRSVCSVEAERVRATF